MTDVLDHGPTPSALLAAYQEQLRARILPDDKSTLDADGPLVRKTRHAGRGFLTYRDLGGLTGGDLDALIDRQREHWTALGRPVEWKLHGHDEPADLPARLAAAGFAPQDRETVIVGEVAGMAGEPVLAEGLRIREVTAHDDFVRIQRLMEAVWGVDCSWIPGDFAHEVSDEGDPAVIIVVEDAGGLVVCASWVRFHAGTEFASFHGGSTLAEWRGRGVYKATVAYRARLAAARGFRYVHVDASDDSRPILRRLGLFAVASTTPYVLTPA
ncbi:N-acetyltransferase [Actinorhabdospora filicis]|uniref:N-acetyltransferase n=1 Tax=Actinorhabdospora filicis TaxID=1785913 RepID=A0A9W6WC59_9ACTN|nr:GNAT family N-acetyltransferase [Actinorhabdospora filicis]GLZ80271.1 N-acetyltransferase [Actinorhabdospora filicis]